MSLTSTAPCTLVFVNGGLSQNLAYIGINAQGVLYGVELALYLETMHTLLLRRRESRKPYDMFYAIFGTVVILLISVWVATEAQFGKELWILSKIYPSGTTAIIRDYLLACGTVSIIVLQLMTDALMIYRCWMLWDRSLVIIMCLILWVAALVLGILMAWSASTQGEQFLFGVASRLGLAYYTITVFLNVVSTAAICYRMIHLGREVSLLGHKYSTVYFSVASLVVESMLPYTLAGIAFLVSFGFVSPTLVPFMSMYVMLMCLSSQLLIFRATTRSTWETDTCTTSKPLSTMKFSPVEHPQSPQARVVNIHERSSTPKGEFNV